MKRSGVWVLAAIAVVCLQWSLTVKASMNPTPAASRNTWSPGPENRILLRRVKACEF